MSKTLDFNRHPPVCFRLSLDEKEVFKEAARKDGKALGTWLRWLARQRIAELEKTGRTD